MITMPQTTPVSPDRVLAGALRLSLVPLIDQRRAIEELVELAHGEPAALSGALERLRRERGSGRPSRASVATEGLLERALQTEASLHASAA